VNDWLETYRGIVYRWEVDHNDHLTVAFYFARLGDATLALLDSLGLGTAYTRRRGSLCVTADCYVRYVRELRVGDLMHVVSGVVAVERDALVLGHKLFNSETGEVCTTVEQRVRHVEA
jgi:acyl-CoA thioester hydrolase